MPKLGGYRNIEAMRVIDMLRLEFERNVVDVATVLPATASLMPKRDARDAHLSDATASRPHADIRWEVGRLIATTLPLALSALRLKSNIVRFDSRVAKQDLTHYWTTHILVDKQRTCG